MTHYTVQYTLPVDNPVNNVSGSKKNGCYYFQVPINHPDAHNFGFLDLIAAVELSGLITVSPTLNKNRLTDKKSISKPAA